jgi:ribosomal protein S18 acetylase RimI-like enzyme
MSSITISDTTIPNAKDAIALYVSLGCGAEHEYDPVIWQGVLKNSKLITAWEGKKLVGLTRYLTDGHHDTCIIECCVAPDYQGNGIGRAMMDRLIALYGHTSLYVNALNGKKDFFEKLDLLERPAMTAMSRKAA